METLIKNLRAGDYKNNKLIVETLLIKSQEDEEEYYNTVGEICDYIYMNKLTSEDIKPLLEPMDEEEDLDCVIIMLCRDFVTSNTNVKYIVNNLSYLSDIINMLSLLFYKKMKATYSTVAENLLYCYDYELTNQDIDVLLKNIQIYINDSKDRETQNVKEYLESKKTFDREDYEAPYWVSLTQGENISLLSSVPTGETYDLKEKAKYEKLPEFIKNFFYEFVPKEKKNKDEDGDSSFFYDDLPENIKDSINTFLKVSNESEGSEFEMKIGNPDRVWGPINRVFGEDCCSGPDGKGPCRMLQCECLETDYDNEDDIYDPSDGLTWFKGRCDGCNQFIGDISHALRFPSKNGSWKGCYCSFDCLVSDPPYLIESQENILLGIMKQTINKVGIMDRSSFC